MNLKNLTKIAMVLGFSTSVALSTQATAATELRPNLIPKPPYEITLVKDQTTGIVQLEFSALTWNAGAGPMELRGGEINPDGTQNVYQRVYYSDGTYYDHLAGAFTYHPEHNHFHFDDYANYTLTAADGSVIEGQKTSFCLLDTDKIDGRLVGSPGNAVYTTCNNIVQGISVGWGDAYRYYLPGQSLDVTNLPKGTYQLCITSNPNGNIIETNVTDDQSCISLDIDVANLTVNNTPGTGTGGSTSGGGVTLTQLTPNKIVNGATASETIKGTGFTSGLPISFVNGSGPTPNISNIKFVDSQTITMTVSAKKTGGQQIRVWDLKVGSAELFQALTIVSTPNR